VKTDAKAAAAPAAAASAAGAAGTAGAANAAGANGKKGITIVAPKPVKKVKTKTLEMPVEPLIKPGMKWKPLIASGPKAPPSTGIPGVAAPTEFKPDPKARLAKKELDQYKKILLEKRSELIGDINNMEDEALRQSSGSLSTLPQHMAEQGSDTFEQSLSLDLAQVDRHLLKEIEAALVRIEHGTYGVCERTGKRISAERLAELPWARYSIEAAREMERRPTIERSEASSDDESL
jgi:RNA polymerase-binding transcription factor DksA